jgi:hypothetical protein
MFHFQAKEYEAVENVRHFLESCKVLGLPDKELFQPDDLIENKNWFFHSVSFLLHLPLQHHYHAILFIL